MGRLCVAGQGCCRNIAHTCYEVDSRCCTYTPEDPENNHVTPGTGVCVEEEDYLGYCLGGECDNMDRQCCITADGIPLLTPCPENRLDVCVIVNGPAVSEWGLMVLTLLAMTLGTIMLARRQEKGMAETG